MCLCCTVDISCNNSSIDLIYYLPKRKSNYIVRNYDDKNNKQPLIGCAASADGSLGNLKVCRVADWMKLWFYFRSIHNNPSLLACICSTNSGYVFVSVDGSFQCRDRRMEFVFPFNSAVTGSLRVALRAAVYDFKPSWRRNYRRWRQLFANCTTDISTNIAEEKVVHRLDQDPSATKVVYFWISAMALCYKLSSEEFCRTFYLLRCYLIQHSWLLSLERGTQIWRPSLTIFTLK